MTGKYQAYPEYKESGFEWLGKIPELWKPIKFGITNSSAELGGNYLAGEGEEGIPVIKMGNLGRGIVNLNKVERLPANEHYDSGHLLKEGDFLFNTRNSLDLVGKVSIWRGELDRAVYNSNVLRITFYDKFVDSTAFMTYLFNSDLGLSQLRLIAKGTTSVAAIYYKELSALIFAFPPIEEQEKIANFLDHETAKIYTLIEKQQQLIKLLKEKRQAVISHAVTKGLNPNAPMRNSGVEWLGEVPEHWDIVPVKHISKIRYGIGEPPKYQDQGVPLIRATNIRSGKISEIGLVLVNPDDIPGNRIVWLDAGDIIVVRSGAGTGDSSIIPREYEGSIAGFDMVVRPTKCLPEFLGHVLLSNYVRNNQIDLEKTRAAQPHLNAEELGECFVILPTDEEQQLIVAHIDREILKFDKLVLKAEKAIRLMQERRTALISAAVTGKIDIRNWQVPEPSNNKNKEVAA